MRTVPRRSVAAAVAGAFGSPVGSRGVTGAARLHDRRPDILSAWGAERNRNINLFLIIVNGWPWQRKGQWAQRPGASRARAGGPLKTQRSAFFRTPGFKCPLTMTVFGLSLEETRQWPRLYRLLAHRGARSADNTTRDDFGEGTYEATFGRRR